MFPANSGFSMLEVLASQSWFFFSLEIDFWSTNQFSWWNPNTGPFSTWKSLYVYKHTEVGSLCNKTRNVLDVLESEENNRELWELR